MTNIALNTKKVVVLSALAVADDGLTADEFVTSRGWYVNSWAPTFTHLKDEGLTRWTGVKRPTSHGSKANVAVITEQGREALAAVGGTL